MTLVGLVSSIALVVLQPAEVVAGSTGCAATTKLAAIQAQVPGTDETQQLRARIREASKAADVAETADGRPERRTSCIQALLTYADVALEVFQGDVGEREAAWARRLAVEMSLQSGPFVGPPAPKPPLTPQQQWERRRRMLVGHTAASGVFTGIGALLLTVPWIVLASSCGPETFCEGTYPIVMSLVGAPILVGSVIPLFVWSGRLQNHRRSRTSGLEIVGGRARVRFSGPLLRFDF